MFAPHGSEESALLERADDCLTSLPVLVLNVHSRCNCRCVMCDIWKRDQTRQITAAALERHRESLRRLGVEWVVLSGGEPLMHRDLSSLCEFFRDLKVRLTLLTTGLLLARRANEVAILFDDVIVSLDGPPEVHDRIRRVEGSFRLIQEGVSGLRSLRPEMRITGRTTVQKKNHRRLHETAVCAKGLGFDAISFLAADLTSEAFNRPQQWSADRQDEIALSSTEIDALDDELEKLNASRGGDMPDDFIAESPAKLLKIAAHFRAHLGMEAPRSPMCNAPWVSAVIEADGSVRPCFFHRPLGHLADGSLEEVVNSAQARALRKELDIENNPICQRCVCSLYRS